MISVMRLIEREILLQWRTRRHIINVSIFFLMVLLLFPLSFEANIKLFQKIYPGLIWIAILFTFLLSAEGILIEEHESGVLEQWLLAKDALYTHVRVKLIVNWFVHLLPILMICFCMGIVFGLSWHAIFFLMLSIICGSPMINALCAFSAVFSLSLKNKGVLSALIVLPLTLPAMIFGAGVLNYLEQGFSVDGQIALLLAFSILSLLGLPYAIGLVISMSLVEGSRL